MIKVVNEKMGIERCFENEDEAFEFIEERISDSKKTNKVLANLEDFKIEEVIGKYE